MSAASPHILVIASWYPSSREPGSGAFIRDQVMALHRAGVTVRVLAPSLRSLASWRPGARTPGYELDDDDGVTILRHEAWRRFPLIEKLNHHDWIDHGLEVFTQYIQQFDQPDLIHAHCAFYGGALAARIRRQHATPYIITEHHSVFATTRLREWERELARDAFCGATTRLAVSPAFCTLLERHFGLPWQWVPNVVSPRFTISRRNRGAPGGRRFRFLHAGAMRPVKGQEDLLTAFASAFGGKTNIELRIAGAGPRRGRLETFARDLRIDRQVNFLGTLTRESMATEMAQADAFVLPSRYETFGVVLIEALACGVPVVATTSGGPECIVNERNGLLVPPRNHDALADAMLRMTDTAHTYDPARLREDALARFGEPVLVDRLKNVYADAIRKPAADLTPRRRVAVLSIHPLYDTRVSNHLAALVDQNCAVTYINWSHTQPIPSLPQLKKVHLVHRDASPAFGVSVPRYVEALRWFTEQAAAPHADIYHIHDLFLLPVAVRLPGKVVFDIHENYKAFGGRVRWFATAAYRCLARFIDGYVSTCPANLPETTTPSVIIPNCQSRSAFDAAPKAIHPGINVVYFGSLSPVDRDVTLMLDVAEHCLTNHPAVRFAFGGPTDATTDRRLTTLAATHGDRFRWLGEMSRDAVVTETVAADVGLIFVQPTSPNLAGGSWNKIYEYLTVGTAILATDGFDIASEVRTSGAGILFPPAALACEVIAALSELLDSPARLAAMKAASARLGQAYAWEAVRDRYKDLYDHISK